MRRRCDQHRFRGAVSHTAAAASLAAALWASVAPAALAGDGPVDTVLKAFDLKTDPGTPSDFVEQSRPATESDYIPVGTRHPERAIKVKTPAELKAMEAGLDAARARQDKIAGRTPPPETPTPARKLAKPARSAATQAPPAAIPPTQN